MYTFAKKKIKIVRIIFAHYWGELIMFLLLQKYNHCQTNNKYCWPLQSVQTRLQILTFHPRKIISVHWQRRMICAQSSRLGFHGCGDDSKDDGDHSEALGKDASPHQELRLPGLALMEGTEAVHQRSCCCQTTWRGRS